jgi:5'-nucleotidase
MRNAALASLALLGACAGWAQPFRLTVLHTNDMHAHYLPTKVNGEELGGYSRMGTLIEQLRAESVNPILLNGGDTFQGTFLFNTYQGLADLAVMNALGFQAMAVGNHEFDLGPAPLAEFAKRAQFPLLAANLDVSGEPLLKDLIKPSTVLTVAGEKIGVIGAITPDTPFISSPGDNVKFLPLQESLQSAIDDLQASGVNKVILLSHCGVDVERELARQLRGIDLIVGGHSHTLLGKIAGAQDVYPIQTFNRDGHRALVVQAWDWGKVVGRIELEFNKAGHIISWDKEGPVPVTASLPDHPLIASMIAAFERPMAEAKNRAVGSAEGSVQRGNARSEESAMGNLVADAILEQLRQSGAVVALMNGGGLRADLPGGTLTYGQLIEVMPFANTLVVLDLTGAELKQALEHGVSTLPQTSGAFLHVSRGSSYVINIDQPAMDRLSDIVVAGEAWRADAVYRTALLSFTANGGDNHQALKAAQGRRLDTGFLDVDALVEFVRRNSPIAPKLEERISMAYGASAR